MSKKFPTYLLFPLFILLFCGTLSAQNSAIHKVKSGETLFSISRKYNVTVDQLKSMNNLKDDLIKIGQELVIFFQTQTENLVSPLPRRVQGEGEREEKPTREESNIRDLFEDTTSIPSLETARPPVVETQEVIQFSGDAQPNAHLVQTGETMESIAALYGLAIEDLIVYNARKTVRPGERVIIPDGGIIPSSTTPETTSNQKITEPAGGLQFSFEEGPVPFTDFTPGPLTQFDVGRYFSVTVDGVGSYYALYGRQKVGETVYLIVPGREELLALKVVRKLTLSSKEVIGLSPKVIDLLKAAGAKDVVKLYYE
ncbi:MAG: LysM peptidoglycan-binding domain-containing protein [Bacteroidota bacterium]